MVTLAALERSPLRRHADRHATDIGLLPGDWSVERIGELAPKVGSGVTPRGGSKVYLSSGRPFVRSQNVGWGSLLLNELVYISDAIHSTFSATEVHSGDVLLNITGASIGRCAIADERLKGGNVNQHVCIIRTDPARANSRFLGYVLLSDIGQRQIDSFQAGGNRQGLNFGQVRSMLIPLPPIIKEQERIAEALEDADARIESLETLIAKKRAIKQGAMQELLTGKRRLPGFGGEWVVSTLGAVCKTIVDGTHFTPQYVDAGIPFYSVENVTADDFVNTKFIAPDEHQVLSRRCKPERGDILLTRIGAIGDTKLIDWDVNASIYVSLALLKCGDETDPGFLYAYTKSGRFRKDIEDRSLLNASPKKINMGDIGNVPIPVPDRDEQAAISAVVADLEADVRSLEDRLSKARHIKQGMMQELLTGRVRLV